MTESTEAALIMYLPGGQAHMRPDIWEEFGKPVPGADMAHVTSGKTQLYMQQAASLKSH